MQITPIPCLTDNYAYIINDNNSKIVGVVDPSEASPIISFLNKKNLKLSYILNTHHHFDHIGGNTELKKLYNAKVVGFIGDKHRIPGIDITLKDNEKWTFENSQVKILHIPGHTLGHICFFFEKEKVAFTGDTLFSLGCGRIFEGNHNQITKFVGLSLMECGDLGKQNLDLVNTDGNLDPVSCNNTNDTLAREFMSHFESKKFRSAFELILITNGLNSHYNFFFTVKNIIFVKLSSVES